jgi:hypothetical protein
MELNPRLAQIDMKRFIHELVLSLLSLSFTLIPVIKFFAVTTTPPLEPQNMTGVAILFGGLLAFMYFTNSWAMQRVSGKLGEGTVEKGNAILIVWINAVGCSFTCCLGANFCLGLYLEQPKPHFALSVLLSFVLVPLFLMWRILFGVLDWYRASRHHFHQPSLITATRALVDWKMVLNWSIPCLMVSGFAVMCELSLVRSILLCGQFVFESFAIGSYAAFCNDYLPRAQKIHGNGSKELGE